MCLVLEYKLYLFKYVKVRLLSDFPTFSSKYKIVFSLNIFSLWSLFFFLARSDHTLVAYYLHLSNINYLWNNYQISINCHGYSGQKVFRSIITGVLIFTCVSSTTYSIVPGLLQFLHAYVFNYWIHSTSSQSDVN